VTRRAAFVFLFGRRQQPSRWLLVGAAGALVIVALAGLRHGALAWYAALATLCLLQVLYPTFAGWCLVFVLFLGAAFVYSFLVIEEVIRIWTGRGPPELFLGPVKTVATILQYGMVVFVAIRLVFVRPRLLAAQNAA
jgi:hypothetical protein